MGVLIICIYLQHSIIKNIHSEGQRHIIEHTDLKTETWTVTHLCAIADTDPVQMLKSKDQGPYSWKILVLRVAPSNKILRKFLEMWVFPLKFKEKILVKKK